MSLEFVKKGFYIVAGLLFLSGWSFAHVDVNKHAHYAELNYDVVYVRCPRAAEQVKIPNGHDTVYQNWKGVNDLWLSARNNIYHQPGCDLVLHHSDPNYGGGLPAGDPGREEVLVECDEANIDAPICTIADPNVSLDGNTIVYTKFMDTRNSLNDLGIRAAGRGEAKHFQATMNLYPDGQNGIYGEHTFNILSPFNAPALIFKYDLTTQTETQVSPDEKFFAGRALPGKDPEWTSNVQVMDTGPFYLPDGRIGFTSNRADGVLKFQMFAMDADGKNLELVGYRGIVQQLHPTTLQDGRIMYTNMDAFLQKGENNAFSLFTINPDGSDPFIFAGENDATHSSFHYATQLSDGDIVTTLYYDANNTGLGSFLRFPVDPVGPDFINYQGSEEHPEPHDPTQWRNGSTILPFSRVGQFILTAESSTGDIQMPPYANAADRWIHPSRSVMGKNVTIGGQVFAVDKAEITMKGKFTHPSGAPDNDLLATYTIGGSSVIYSSMFSTTLDEAVEVIGKDAGVWLLPLEPNSTRQVGHIADDGLIVVDRPEYHEIMPRAVVPYSAIHGMPTPVQKPHTPNKGEQDPRLIAGEPFGLTGAASLIDRETQSLNGTPWNMYDGGGGMSGRTYLNLAAQGGELAIYGDDEIWGIRVSMLIPPVPWDDWGGTEQFAGVQNHHLRILGEYPVRKPTIDSQGNVDTSFVVKIPADTPFFFQAIDKRGMALNMETTSRTVTRGEQQLCGGCHVHTRNAQDAFQSEAKLDVNFLGDFSGHSALLASLDADGVTPIVKPANEIYTDVVAPGVTSRRSFGVDWENGVDNIIQNRCAGCHGEGQSAQVQTGLRLDGDVRTYELLVYNRYTREDGVNINSFTKPGDGLTDLDSSGTDRITPRFQCCTPSRWLSLNSARSSMLIWALYGERLDGRDPSTGLPAPDSGVLTDPWGRDYPEVWPKVSEHGAYLVDMPEEEKRLLARWIDLGAAKSNTHNDVVPPVLTLTPVMNGSAIDSILVGVWDDSPVDYSRFNVLMNGADITPLVSGTPNVIEVLLTTPISEANADSLEFTFEIWDKPNRSLSLQQPTVTASNRTRKSYNGRRLMAMANSTVNAAPTTVKLVLETYKNFSISGLPIVSDPDAGDVHFYSIVAQPTNGVASVENNKVVYIPNSDYFGTDKFSILATDMSGASVQGSVEVVVIDAAPPAPPVPGDGDTVPGDGDTVPGDGGTVPGDGGTVPGDGGTVPGDGGTVPGDGDTIPGDGGTVPGDGDTVPGDGDTVSVKKEGNISILGALSTIDMLMIGLMLLVSRRRWRYKLTRELRT